MNQLPKDLGGYQHIEPGQSTAIGDIWVVSGTPRSFVDLNLYPTVPGTEESMFIQHWNVYRKIPCPGCRDDKGELWGEKKVFTTEEMMNMTYPNVFYNGDKSYIPQDDKSRKMAPMARGCLFYFPAALFEVAAHSMESDLKHNPGATDGPTWARSKSSDHADCIIRHLVDAGTRGTPDRKYHLRALAWRSLALLQEECEADGALPGVSSR